MKVELTPTPPKEKQFEPFSVTFTFETEQEACNMYHRLNARPIGTSDKVRFPINSEGEMEMFNAFNQIMIDKRLRKP